MKTIPDSRLSAVEPIVKVIGMTENGDLLVEDRNSRQFSIKQALVAENWWPPLMTYAETAATEVTEVVEDEPGPAPEPKKPRARRKKG